MKDLEARLRYGSRYSLLNDSDYLFYCWYADMTFLQEGWLAKHAVSDEDRLAAEQARNGPGSGPEDPMQGLEGLDVAGPQPV